MVDWAIAALEMEYRTKALKDEAEHARLVKLARAARPQDKRLRRTAAGLNNMAAWLTCQLQSRLSPEADAAAC